MNSPMAPLSNKAVRPCNAPVSVVWMSTLSFNEVGEGVAAMMYFFGNRLSHFEVLAVLAILEEGVCLSSKCLRCLWGENQIHHSLLILLTNMQNDLNLAVRVYYSLAA